MRKGEGVGQRKHTHTHTPTVRQRARGKGVGEGGEQRGDRMQREKDLTWGAGRMMQGADDAVLSCTLEACMGL